MNKDEEKLNKNDKLLWKIINTTKLRVRFSRGTAIVFWTQGSFIPGDFADNIYNIDVHKDDLAMFEKQLKANKISYVAEIHSEVKKKKQRPLAIIIPKDDFNVERKKGFPLVPLKEFVEWCKDLELEQVLEVLDLKYNLGLGIKYSEVLRNVVNENLARETLKKHRIEV